jgi:demethylmenaquinone methyltransferase / 2-methoxy-6-polyprenyl-1,4-benzoquinol methylase
MHTKDEPRRDASQGTGAMFDGIARRYDLLNRILSLGLDQGWRRRAVRALRLGPGCEVLDLATGTGDMALLVKRRHPEARVVGVDPSRGMLDVAVEKARRAGAAIDFRVGDAEALDIEDDRFDATCIAFGIRNVPDRPRALREMARVTRTGGRVVILELSEPQGRALGSLAKVYIHSIVPRIGGAVCGGGEYAYLERSIAAFPPRGAFAKLMEEAGLDVLEVAPLTFGAACLFVATPRKDARRRGAPPC